MTGRTICAKLAVMTIILFMAGITISRCAFEHVVDMARLTLDLSMFACEFEGCKIVIELRRLTGLCCVA